VDHIREAFLKAIEDSKPVTQWWVTLWVRSPFYGGPEEGGWWGEDSVPIQYATFSTEEAAEAAVEKINEVAEALKVEAKKSYGRQCLLESAWLEARGLDDDYLPEVDGEDSYFVSMSERPPEARYGSRVWD
jgi:hypothetical protein